jgi:putative PEP-CTERM system TPR-repeat lipoprotein
VKSILRVLLLLPLLLAGLTGCGGEQSSSLLASAKDYLAKKDNRAAVIQLKSALQKQPELAEARFLLGRALLDDGNAVSGEVELRKALDFKYPQDAVLPLLVRALVQQGKAQQAIQEFGTRDFAQSPPAAAELKTALATAYMQQGDSPKAQSVLDDALRTTPDYLPALLIQARLRAAANDVDSALALLDKVLAKESTNVEALQLKGDLLFIAKGDGDSALAVLRQALAVRPDWLPAHASILEILFSRPDLAAAKIQVEQLKKIHPAQPQTRFSEARLAFLNKDYKSAHELLQSVVATTPDNPRVLFLAAAIELQLGSLPQAEDFASKALRRLPNSPVARRLLAQIQINSGQSQSAQVTLQPLLEKADADPESLILAAQAALQLGDGATAESYFVRAAKSKPSDPRSPTALALIESAKGHPDLAFAQLEKISASDPGMIADLAIISARMRRREFDAALKGVESLERKQPDKPFAAQLRGQIEMARGNSAAARTSFEKALTIDPLYFPAAARLASLDLTEKKPDTARKRFDKLLAADPKDIRALVAIAELRSQTGASKEELAGLLANAIKLNPTTAFPRLMLVDLHLRNKDYRSAVAAAQEGVAALADNTELMDALGRAQLASGDSAQAINVFNKLAAEKPRSPEVRMRLAEAHMAAKNPAAARESLDRALEIEPKYLPAQRGLMMLDVAAGRPDQAMVVARAVQTERPTQGIGYLLAGDIETSRKAWDAALAQYRVALSREPSTAAAVKVHAALGRAKKDAEADVFANTWKKEHPQDADFRTYLGDLALSRSDFPHAESEFLSVLSLQPENPVALNNLAWISNKLRKPGATAYAEKANALQPDQPAFLDTLATVLADSGQASKALDFQKRAVSLQPDFPAFRLNLAKLYIKAGEKSLARKELDELAKLGDTFTGQAEVVELLKTL